METILKRDEQAILLLRKLYQSYGYRSYKMSRFEEYDLYVRNKNFLVSDQVITFSDRTGKLLALKPDVTLSIIKNAGKTSDTQRVYYNENVYRVDPQTKTFREIMQTGLECVGNLCDADVAEVVLLAAKSLQKLGENFVLDISHMGIVEEVMASSGLSQAGKEKAILLLHQKNSHELLKLCAEENCDPTGLQSLIHASGEPMTVLAAVGDSTAACQLRTICKVLTAAGFGDKIRIDFSVSSDLKYYSGVVFKGYLQSITTWILSGGQYDKLLQKMGRTGNAVGFAIYLNLLEKIRQTKAFDVDAVLLYGDDDEMDMLFPVAEALRSTENVLTTKQIPTGLKYRKLYKLQEGEAILLEDNG